ncbi:DUF4097 family beta strand repeat-containing protein [Actinopolyspora sp. H202]|uniref:DUF4097 family beta strand repeat-containing protein n=1 Tax=Actinopolyspora sp. H202 TaxID=1500456 RepID=UPI003EE66443
MTMRTGLAVGGAVLVLLGGAVLAWGGPSDTSTGSPSGVTAVELRSGAGAVDISYEAGAEPRVREERDGWWGGWGRNSETSYRVEDGGLVLDADCGWGCDVEYEVTLPRRVPVTGTLGSGSLEVTGMSSTDVRVDSGALELRGIDGEVRAETGSGGIELTDIGGPVNVSTGSGQIEGEDIDSADVTTRTSSGGISLELSEPRSVRADTGSGGIELTVPANSYSVRADTGSGSTDIEVPRDADSERSLRLSTGSGSIEVESS